MTDVGSDQGETPLARRLAGVQEAIGQAASQAGRDEDTVTLIVVTKFHPSALVRDLHRLGVRHFGESRHQDAAPKIAALADIAATWHFVGQLQSKKARQVGQYVDVVHSLDRDSLSDALAGVDCDVFIQVDLSGETGRGGVQPVDVERLAVHAMDAGLRIRGLMTVAPLQEEPRRAFSRIRQLSDSLRSVAPHASELSMGMSGDFYDAILEGATHLRIGTAITGNRPGGG